MLSNRYEYLKACFWSIYPVFPFIAVGVLSLEDKDWILSSGLPFYDIILMENLPKSSALPVATITEVKNRLFHKNISSLYDGTSSSINSTGRIWDFKYIYYTESDQILIVKELAAFFKHLDKYPRRMMLPHRLMPYPHDVISKIHGKNIDSSDMFSWMNKSCCVARQNCISRADWLHIKDPVVEVVNIYGIQVPLGNSHFKIETYRHCTLYTQRVEQCP